MKLYIKKYIILGIYGSSQFQSAAWKLKTHKEEKRRRREEEEEEQT